VADTLTTTKSLTKPASGSHQNAWDVPINANFDLIDAALGATLTKSISGDVTLSSTEAENIGYIITGTLSANATVTFPTFYGPLYAKNGTSGSKNVILAMGASATITVLPGETVAVMSDGANLVLVGSSISISKVLVDTQTASGAASLSVSLVGSFKNYEIHLNDLLPGTAGAALWYRVSANGGSSYISSAGTYGWGYTFQGGGANAASNSNSDTAIQIAVSVSNTSGQGASSIIFVTNGPNSNWGNYDLGYVASPSGNIVRVSGSGQNNQSAITNIQFFPGTGTISGLVKVYGIRG
jgi:hypothetical protein